MNERKWQACSDLHSMLRLVKGEPVGVLAELFGWRRQAQVARQPSFRASQRQLRLFAVACCRRFGLFLTDARLWQGLEAVEHYADGLAGQLELEAALAPVEQLYQVTLAMPYAQRTEYHAAVVALRTLLVWEVEHGEYGDFPPDMMVANQTAGAYWHTEGTDSQGVRRRGFQEQAKLVRDIMGNPFRSPNFHPAWLTWRDATIPKLAQSAYESRQLPSGHLDPALLNVLADALEEVGCTDGEVTGHLRSEGPHVRGCWPVDCLLGKS